MFKPLFTLAPTRRLALSAALATAALLGTVTLASAQEYYSAPVVDPTLDNPGAVVQPTDTPRYGYLSVRELRAKATELAVQEQNIRAAQNAVTAELARRGTGAATAQQ